MAKKARGSKPKTTQRRGGALSSSPASDRRVAAGALALDAREGDGAQGATRHSRMVPRGTTARDEAGATLDALPRTLAAPKAATLLSPAADPFPSAASLDALTTSRTDELESEPFFSRPDVSVLAIDDDEPWDVVDPQTRRHEPEVVERRARLSKVVARVVAAAVILGVLGGARAWLGGGAQSSQPASAAVAERPSELAPRAPTEQATAAIHEIAPAAAPVVEPPALASAVTPSTAERAPAEPRTELEPAQPSPVAPTVSARASLSQAKRALEAGSAAKARAQAEIATTVDPGDAEAWLVLGAAHQELGDMGRARAAFRKCTEVASRGPKGECAALLR